MEFIMSYLSKMQFLEIKVVQNEKEIYICQIKYI